MEVSASELWEKILKIFEKTGTVNDVEYNMYFKNTEAGDLSNGTLLLNCNSSLVKDAMEKYKNEIISLYTKDQQNKVNLAMYGPPIFPNSPFLVKAVENYRKDELRKEYSYGNYQDKGLPKNKELNISPQSYVKKKNSTIVDINEYLRNLRKGVDR